MRHAFEVSAETYEHLTSVAAERGRTPEELFASWVAEVQNGATPTEPEARTLVDPWKGLRGAAEASSPDVTLRHDHYLAEASSTDLEMHGAYDPQKDPLAPFLGAFTTDTPDLVRRHDAYLAEAPADAQGSPR